MFQTGERLRLGDRLEGACLRQPRPWKATGAACRGRTAGAAPSKPHATRCGCDQKNRAQIGALVNTPGPRQSSRCHDSTLSGICSARLRIYGAPWPDPRTLVLWEAQFGDFCQRRADHDRHSSSQAAEAKWLRANGPRDAAGRMATKGKGPEHSSARARNAFLPNCAPTGQYPGLQHYRELPRPTISTPCAGRWLRPGFRKSRWSYNTCPKSLARPPALAKRRERAEISRGFADFKADPFGHHRESPSGPDGQSLPE